MLINKVMQQINSYTKHIHFVLIYTKSCKTKKCCQNEQLKFMKVGRSLKIKIIRFCCAIHLKKPPGLMPITNLKTKLKNIEKDRIKSD